MQYAPSVPVSPSTTTAIDTSSSYADVLVQPLVQRGMLWQPTFQVSSPWLAHVPFIFWLIEALRPRVVADINVGTGVAYFAFCQAIERLGLGTRCFGFVSELERASVSDLENYNRQNYHRFSRLSVASQENARDFFEDGSVDLLNIDLIHNGGSENKLLKIKGWLGKLSSDAVILIHGTSLSKGMRLPQEIGSLDRAFRYFEIPHEKGLGVVVLGQQDGSLIDRFTHLAENPHVFQSVEVLFERLGTACSDRYIRTHTANDKAVESQQRHTGPDQATKALIARAEAAESKVALLQNEINELRSGDRKNTDQSTMVFKRQIGELEQIVAKQHQELANRSREIALLTEALLKERSKDARLNAMTRPVSVNGKGVRSSTGFLTKVFFPAKNDRKRLHKEIAVLRRSSLFDEQWYLLKNPDVKASHMNAVEHYIKFGAREGRNPGPNFDTKKYLAEHPELVESGENPLVHYIAHEAAYRT